MVSRLLEKDNTVGTSTEAWYNEGHADRHLGRGGKSGNNYRTMSPHGACAVLGIQPRAF